MIICCPVCGSDDAARFLEANTAEGPLLVQRCRRCEHGFLERQPEKFEADRYEYYRKYLGKPLELRQRPLNERRFDDLLSTWGPQVAGRRLLDLGCGDGQMVRVANDRGWQAEGLDLSASAIELAQS
jgi:2-polyprenyl-3-methyl-5-hydroxy-6-metoxy-1,4-benzoquinol methylase